MTKEEFDAAVAAAKSSNPIWFEAEREAPASADAILGLEARLSAKLPAEYVDFIARYGAGPFAFALVLGVQPGTGWELIEHARNVPAHFVPASDAETGDYYGFIVKNGVCEGCIAVWDHEDGSVLDGQYANFYEMLAARALQP
jgi:hypothetical protein